MGVGGRGAVYTETKAFVAKWFLRAMTELCNLFPLYTHTEFSTSLKAFLRNTFPEVGGAGERVCGMDAVLEGQLLLSDFFEDTSF